MAKKSAPKSVPLMAPTLKRPASAKAVIIQLKPDSHRAIRQLALDLDTTVQGLGIEAFNLLMTKHGRKEKIVSAWE
jgi:hypothetical protein